MLKTLSETLAKLLPFLSPSPTAIKNVLNADELWRTVKTSATAGLIATAIGVLVAIQGNLANILDPTVLQLPFIGGAIAAGLTKLIDELRRLYQGSEFPE